MRKPNIGAGSRDRGFDPPPTLSVSVSPASASLQVGAAVGSRVVTATLDGGTGSGTWTLTLTGGPTGRTSILRLRTTTGQIAVVEVARAIQTEDVSTAWTWTVGYLGDGLGNPVTRSFAVTVLGGVASISFSPAEPDVALPVASGVTLTTATVSTAGTGQWTTRVGHWAGASLAATTGKNVIVRSARAFASSDVGDKTISLQYTGDGLSSPLTASTTLTIRSASGAPTWKYGLSDNGTYAEDISTLETYKNAFGVQPKCMTIFSTSATTYTWAQIAATMASTTSKLYKVLKWCKDNDVLPIITLPICSYADFVFDAAGPRGNFGPVNAGNYDDDITTFAQRIRTLFGTREVVFRIGHEPTHFPWRIGKSLFLQTNGVQSAKNAWARVASKLRAGMGVGHNAYIAYCHTIAFFGNSDGDLTGKGLAWLTRAPYNRTKEEAFLEFFPGTSSVDIISWDFYDAPGPMPTSTNYDTWVGSRRFAYDVAVNQNTLFGVDEWGLMRKFAFHSNDGDTGTLVTFPSGSSHYVTASKGCGDNPDFISHVHKMFSGMSSTRFIYASYFRMFESKYDRADVLAGETDRASALHCLSGRTGATANGKSLFEGKSDGLVTTMKGDVVGWDHTTATGDAFDKYKRLFHPPTT